MKKILMIIGLLGVIGGGIGYYLYNKPHKNMMNTKPSAKLEASAIFTEYETDETAANEKYLGKVVEVTGMIKLAEKGDDGVVSVTLNTGSEMAGVVCQLDPEKGYSDTDFKAGSMATFRGDCTGMLMDVVLVRCVSISN